MTPAAWTAAILVQSSRAISRAGSPQRRPETWTAQFDLKEMEQCASKPRLLPSM